MCSNCSGNYEDPDATAPECEHRHTRFDYLLGEWFCTLCGEQVELESAGGANGSTDGND